MPRKAAASGGLAAEVASSVAAMTWLKPSDQAAVRLAVTYAEQIDAAIGSGDEGVAVKALYLGPHLLNALRALGGAPPDRKALGVEEAARGKLAQLRAIQGGAAG